MDANEQLTLIEKMSHYNRCCLIVAHGFTCLQKGKRLGLVWRNFCSHVLQEIDLYLVWKCFCSHVLQEMVLCLVWEHFC